MSHGALWTAFLGLALGVCLAGCDTLANARAAAAEKSALPVAPKSELAVVSDDQPTGSGAELLDGFEGPGHTVWAFDAADDEALAQYVEDGATQGQKCLRLTLRDKGATGKLLLRRDVKLDLSQAHALVLDLSSTSEKISVALALKCEPGDVYQESKYVALKSGLNRDVRFSLDESNWKNAESQWQYNAPPVNLAKVKRLMLLFHTNGESAGGVSLDNLRVEADASTYREWRPKIVATSALPRTLPQYGAIEWQAAFLASYRDPFDSNDIAMGARVTTPSGKRLNLRGFFLGALPAEKLTVAHADAAVAPPPAWGPLKESDTPEARPAQIGDSASTWPAWAVRFTPQEAGRYTLQMYVRNKAGEIRTPEQNVVVTPDSGEKLPPGRRGGNVRVSRRDPRYLELQDGSPFFIAGQNVCWTQDWKPYLEKIKAYGGNTVRIWLCPWGLNLERKNALGTYDLAAAERLDELVRQAETLGVRIIFCCTFHGATSDSWSDSPYNAANGGPCVHPEDFFTDRDARRSFQRLLAYATARWGASPAILAWEVINEIDLAGFGTPAEARAWALEMAGFLKSADAHGHLVTVSVSNPKFLPDLWEDNRIDFVSLHGYGADVGGLLDDTLAPFQALHKPVLLAEFGGGWRPEDDPEDTHGVRLQAALWLTACSPTCGLALPWWWDTYIEPLGLYPVLAAAGRFTAGEDRRGRFSEWVKKSFEDGEVVVSGLAGSQGARLFVYRPEWVRQPDARGKTLLDEDLTVTLQGLLAGKYRIEYWDAKDGKPFSSLEKDAEDGELDVTLPVRAGEFGIKVDRREFVRPGVK